jgi:hypothetical protein
MRVSEKENMMVVKIATTPSIPSVTLR